MKKSTEKDLRDSYLDLLEKILVNDIYKDPPLKRDLWGKLLAKFGVHIAHTPRRQYETSIRDRGLDWPSVAHTMIGRQRLSNIRTLLSDVIEREIPGDFVETGVWRGGACIFARGIMKSYDIKDRKVWVADSFAGLPEADGDKYVADKGDTHSKMEVLAVSLEQVQKNFSVYGLLDAQVEFLVGWFKDTLPDAPIKQISVLRLDGDMYESTMDALVALYDRVAPGGYVIVDDYHAVDGCKKAIHDYIAQKSLENTVDIQEIDGAGVYWKKPEQTL